MGMVEIGAGFRDIKRVDVVCIGSNGKLGELGHTVAVRGVCLPDTVEMQSERIVEKIDDVDGERFIASDTKRFPGDIVVDGGDGIGGDGRSGACKGRKRGVLDMQRRLQGENSRRKENGGNKKRKNGGHVYKR